MQAVAASLRINMPSLVRRFPDAIYQRAGSAEGPIRSHTSHVFPVFNLLRRLRSAIPDLLRHPAGLLISRPSPAQWVPHSCALFSQEWDSTLNNCHPERSEGSAVSRPQERSL